MPVQVSKYRCSVRTAVECGNYRDHSLHSAREWSKRILEQGISLDAFTRTGV